MVSEDLCDAVDLRVNLFLESLARFKGIPAPRGEIFLLVDAEQSHLVEKLSCIHNLFEFRVSEIQPGGLNT